MGELEKKTVLVTGGGGFLGGALVKMLIKEGAYVKSFSRRFYPWLDKLGVDQIQGDIKNKNDVEKACENVFLVFHTAALAGIWGDYSKYFNTNFKGTINIIEACKKHKIGYLIHTSSPSVIFDGSDMQGVDESVPYPDTYHAHYPQTKALAEKEVVKAAKEGFIKSIILRPHLIWGPYDNHLVPRILKKAKTLVRIGNGGNLADTIYIDNAAHAHILAAKALIRKPFLSGNIYFISQDEPVFLWDMVNAILKAGGKPPVKRSISLKTAKNIARIIEWAYRTFPVKGEPGLTLFMAEELATSHFFDISAAKKDLGYRPIVSVKEGLKRLETWLRANNISS